MRPLYSALIAKPLSHAAARPTRLGFSTTAWCEGEDLIASASGCGAVAVFHADAPGEVTLLVSTRRAPARHVAWRSAREKPPLLAVADAANRVTFWVARDRRVNVWACAAVVDVPAAVEALGWTSSSSALAAVLADGTVAMWHVPQYPTAQDPVRRGQPRGRHHPPAPPPNPSAAVRPLACGTPGAETLVAGSVQCAHVAPGGVELDSVAVVAVPVSNPTSIRVWTVFLSHSTPGGFDVRALPHTDMSADDDGVVVACISVPLRGALFAVGKKGSISRWYYRKPDEKWVLQARKIIGESDAERANAKAALPNGGSTPSDGMPVNHLAIARAEARLRKVYSIAVTSDSMQIVTSSDSGLVVRDCGELNISATQPLRSMPSEKDGATPSPYWGICLSPSGAAVMALNGEGRIDAISLVCPITTHVKQILRNSIKTVSQNLIKYSSKDGLRGIWDLQASIAVDGSNAAQFVTVALNAITQQSAQAFADTEKLENLRLTMLVVMDPHNIALSSARRLLNNAVNAIKKSASEAVKEKLSNPGAEFKNFVAANITAHVQDVTSRMPRPPANQLGAVPLADWIMVLGAVWLRRCALVVFECPPRNDSESLRTQLGSVWGDVVQEDRSQNSELTVNADRLQGIVRDTRLLRQLRLAATAAMFLLSLEETYREPDADPRYLRFSTAECADIVTALWEISLRWENQNSASQNGQTGANPQSDRMAIAASGLRNHESIARALLKNPKLRILAAEQALGLHGSSMGAGFFLSTTRTKKTADKNGAAEQGTQPAAAQATGEGQTTTPANAIGDNDESGEKTSSGTVTEWCPYDLVTGRPLPPWAPLRRCVLSGLLAAETTMPSANTQYPSNANAPWASQWAYESPFGGRWARVPSLDLDRYELLPAAVSPESDNREHSAMRAAPPGALPPAAPNGSAAMVSGQHMVPAGVPGMVPGIGMHPGIAPGMSSAMEIAAANSATSAAAAAAAAEAAAAAHGGANGMARLGMNAQAAARTSAGTPSQRVHPSPGMSSSTTDDRSTASKGKRKPKASRKSRKKATPDNSATTGAGTATGPTVSGALSYSARTPADDMSTSERSTATAATNGGVVQDITSRKTRSRRGKAGGGSGSRGSLQEGTGTPRGGAGRKGANHPGNLAASLSRGVQSVDAAAAAAAEAAAATMRNPMLTAGGLGVSGPDFAQPGLGGAGIVTSATSPTISASSIRRPSQPVPGQAPAFTAADLTRLTPQPQANAFATSPTGMPVGMGGMPFAAGYDPQLQNHVLNQKRLRDAEAARNSLGPRNQQQLAAAAAAAAGVSNPLAMPNLGQGLGDIGNPAAANMMLGAGGAPGAGGGMAMNAASIAMSNAMLAGANAPGRAAAMGAEDVLAGGGAAAGMGGQPNHARNQLPRGVQPPPNNMMHAAGMNMFAAGGVPGMTGSLPTGPGSRIWQGNLHVRGHRNDMVVPCVAVRYPTPHRPSVVDAAGWPLHLHCDSTKLKQCANVFQYMNEPASQWYVRFAPIDGNGAEIQQPKLVQLVKVMVHRQLAFEIHCDSTPSSTGTLYLWGMQMPPHGYSLLGVFRPSVAAAALPAGMPADLGAAGKGGFDFGGGKMDGIDGFL